MCCGGSETEEGPVLHPQKDEPIPARNPSTPRPGRSKNDPPMELNTGDGNPSSSSGPSNPAFPIVFPDGTTGRPKKRIRRLYCKTGYDIGVFPNGKVAGIKSPRNKYGNLEFESAGLNGEIRIKGVTTGFYVTMTPKGKVLGQPLPNSRGTIWVETKIATGTTYMSLLSLDYAHHGYYLAIKKSGKPKPGPKTAHPYPQKAISFLTRVVAEE
ncbi:unnamed protein product [Allacma fusca]|uniref:Fibroblast growth factor n=1 Tax=Allacma fusca TaxID=39272 RepID=A0A8J2KGX3_9HEXA|nr:unnamed protein product [Allacma fusca]